MHMYTLALFLILNGLCWSDAIGQGHAPTESLRARDVAKDFKLPPLRDQAKDQLWMDSKKLQVLARARALGIDKQSATEAWTTAEITLRKARSGLEPVTASTSAVLFDGTLASQLNELLSRQDIHAVQVTSPKLLIDTPIVFGHNNETLNLAQAELRSTSTFPYAVRIQGMKNILLQGGFLF